MSSVDLQNTLFKHRPYFVLEPTIQLLAVRASFTQELDAEAKLGERHRADVELVKRLARNKRQHVRLGP